MGTNSADERVTRDPGIATIPLQIRKIFRRPRAENDEIFRSERESGGVADAADAPSPTSLDAVEERPESMEEGVRRHRSWLLPLRMLLGGLLITVVTGGAVATAGLLQLKDFTDEFKDLSTEAKLSPDTVTEAPSGKPQTVLLVGSDHRFGDGKDDARSDTMMLVRIDPKQSAITVMSIPRDLAVQIPGHGLAKINDSYTLGGLDLTARTIKQLLSTSKERFHINHAVTTTFGGFVEAVNQIGCVYVDVDRRYYHTNAGLPVSQHWAEINVKAGYQQLCGTRALEYVRFRHLDNDIVRAARQQDFLRAAKDQLRDQGVLQNLRPLARIVAKATETDGNLRTSKGILRLAKILVSSSGKPIRQVHFPATFQLDGGTTQTTTGVVTTTGLGSYVTATPEQIHKAVDEFMHPGPAKKIRPRKPRSGKKKDASSGSELRDALGTGKDLIAASHARRATRMPIYVPAKITQRAQYPTSTALAPNPRRYVITDAEGRRHAAYRLVLAENVTEGQYYGVQGTTWRNPPLLAAAHQTRRIGNRTFSLYADGGRLRLVAWQSRKASYWVSNTLTQDLSNREMLDIAGSLTRVGKGR
jgi:polyisoprenyl-teichoic acid--peptidoglycan teichoic acid transferase